jgi:ribonuclease R
VKSPTDPHEQRESKKYSNPIASREHILDILDNSVGPMSHKQLAKHLLIKDERDKEALRRRLFAMERDGQIYSNRKQAFARVDKLDLIRGRVQGHRDGFGFLIPTDGSSDIYLHSRQMRKVFDRDEALVRLISNNPGDRRDGVIIDVLTRHTQGLVGRYFHEQGVGFVRPENTRITHDVLIAPEYTHGAKHNQFVMVSISQQPSNRSLPMGRIIEILGDHMAPGMEIDVAIRAHDLPNSWPESVVAATAKLPESVVEADEKRIDLRSLPLVTIDGEDARDFDDAVYCEAKASGGWRLFVAIADVSHYVTVGSALDQEANERGTSVYFPDFVLPMLPEALSNELCSLKPKVDRLAMVCEMTISASGRLSGYEFYEALIHSNARLTYTQVGQMLSEPSRQKNFGDGDQYADLLPHIDELYRLFQALRAMRESRGAIDFETTETRILFDEKRKIERIAPVERNNAHKIIEECMLCANVCAARFLSKHKLDGLYRVHEGPREQKLENLRLFLSELGLNLQGKNRPQPSDYQSLLQHISSRSDAKIIQTVMLRSLSQAVYQPENLGHFGLAYPAYTHFTSPIRRYPDLLVHRAIRHVIRSPQSSKHVRRVRNADLIPKSEIYPYSLEDMLRLGEHTSMTERRADDATRDVISWLKCEYLLDHVGDCFKGVITGVTNFGVFVELLDLYVEGLVHVTALPSDYYHFEQAQHRLIGERTRRVFRLGDELQVKVSAVKLDERKVDFELVETQKNPSEKRAKNARKQVKKHNSVDPKRKAKKINAKSNRKTPKKNK